MNIISNLVPAEPSCLGSCLCHLGLSLRICASNKRAARLLHASKRS